MSDTPSLLSTLNLPKDLKTLSHSDLEQLADDIRQLLLDVGNTCGGHLASNLGVVELTIALHSVFDSPKDKCIFDTSHQTYVHKILTGRIDRIHTIRQEGGLSGFAKISESEHDIFGAGHASTALSAALGLAQARNIKGQDNAVIAIIGDASLSGGMAFEALNNIDQLKGNFICILNDNDMSISPPVGAMATYMTRLRTSTSYTAAKETFNRILNRIPKIGVPLQRRIEKAVDRMRDLMIDVKVGVIFEEFGFKYLGPIDGHNIALVMAALKYAKNYPGPIMLHLITTKGKGHPPAEEDPYKYHGVSPKKKESPKITIEPEKKRKTFTEIFGETCIEIAETHPHAVVITPAMTGGSGLVTYAEMFPDRFFDVGIAEEHAVTFAAGLARDGITPILSIYSTFLQRGYDQLVHDVCLQNLPVVFALDRAGIVGQDGATHHGVLDLNYSLSIPNLSILAPKDGTELKHMLHWAVTQKHPILLRYPKGSIPDRDGQGTHHHIKSNRCECLFDSETNDLDIVIIGVGSMAWPAAEAAEKLSKTYSTSAINLRFVKPLDMATLTSYIDRANHILIVEEGQRFGGVFSHILDQCTVLKHRSQWHSIAIKDEFLNHGSIPSLRKKEKLDVQGIIDTANNILKKYHQSKKETVHEPGSKLQKNNLDLSS